MKTPILLSESDFKNWLHENIKKPVGIKDSDDCPLARWMSQLWGCKVSVTSDSSVYKEFREGHWTEVRLDKKTLSWTRTLIRNIDTYNATLWRHEESTKKLVTGGWVLARAYGIIYVEVVE